MTDSTEIDGLDQLIDIAELPIYYDEFVIENVDVTHDESLSTWRLNNSGDKLYTKFGQSHWII